MIRTRRVVRRRIVRRLARVLAALGFPLRAAAVHDLQVLVAVQFEEPVRICCPPVILVAIEDDRRVVRDAIAAHQLRELLRADEIPHERVLQVRRPINLHSAGDMADLVEQDVLITLNEANARIVEMIGDPLRSKQVHPLRESSLLLS